MSDKADKKARTQLLKELREAHQESVERTRELLKVQQATRKEVLGVIEEEAKTIPVIAAEVDLPTEEVLWHVMAMKKYGLVEETGMDGEYYAYREVKES
jgi:predicted transcriptional regulator